MASVNLCHLPNGLVAVSTWPGGKGFAKQDFSFLEQAETG